MQDKNFRLHKSSKRVLATILDAHERGHIRRAMIQAQLISQRQSRRGAARENTDV